MQLLNKNTDYAVRSLMYLGKNRGSYITSREVSTELEIPLQFVRRILQRLREVGLVETKEGVAGGVRLAGDPFRISLKDVIELFQGSIQISACMFRQKLCPNRSKCVLRERILSIEDTMIQQFNQISIQTLLDDTEKVR